MTPADTCDLAAVGDYKDPKTKKLLNTLSDRGHVPFVKSGEARTSPRLYSLVSAAMLVLALGFKLNCCSQKQSLKCSEAYSHLQFSLHEHYLAHSVASCHIPPSYHEVSQQVVLMPSHDVSATTPVATHCLPAFTTTDATQLHLPPLHAT